MTYARHVTATPQTEQADKRQVQNNAGGYAFTLDKWKRLDRWLILGAEGGTYYVKEPALTRDNARTIDECLAEDAARTVRTIVEISQAGRAPKNEPAVFALALAASSKDMPTRSLAYQALPLVCRIGTHLFHFVDAVNLLRGWGPGLRAAIAQWYEGKAPDDLAYQVAKYVRRGAWSHRDVLRLVHLEPSLERASIYRWIVARDEMGERQVFRKSMIKNATEHPIVTYPPVASLPPLLAALDELRATTSSTRVCALIREHRLTHEMIDGSWKAHADVWEALAEHMPIGALIRNLAKLTQVGIISPLSVQALAISGRISNGADLKAARVHPIQVLSALRVYQQGHGERGKLTWQPNPLITDALDAAFYASFENVVPTGKATLIALDISGSMAFAGSVAGMPHLTAREASAALAMVTVRAESNVHVVGFGDRLTPLRISASQRLDDVINTISDLPFERTDCALPMIWAAERGIGVDAFVVLTDNETWFGAIHPHEALRQYRHKRPEAKLAVIGTASTGFTIADPNDPGSMDFVGFDSAGPAVLADFIRGAPAENAQPEPDAL